MTDYFRYCDIIYELKQKCIHGYEYDTPERCEGCPHYNKEVIEMQEEM